MLSKLVVTALVLLAGTLYGCSGDDPAVLSTTGEPAALMTASQTPVSGTYTISPGGAPGRLFVTAGVTHVRDWLVLLAVEGDISGSGGFVQSANWNTAGNGSVWGPFDIAAEWQGRTGSLAGTASGSIHKGWVSLTFTAHGTGGLEGVKWIGNLEGPLGGPVFNYGGHMVDPQDD